MSRFGPKPRPEWDRFQAMVERNTPSGCWLWTGYVMPNGYGIFMSSGGRVLAHRFAYQHLVGPIPEGLTLDHVKERGCTSRACCNPAHLEPVTMRENLLRGDGTSGRNARKTHCPQGHPYDEANTSLVRNRTRQCRACARERMRAKRATT
jgi:hypothetical protein